MRGGVRLIVPFAAELREWRLPVSSTKSPMLRHVSNHPVGRGQRVQSTDEVWQVAVAADPPKALLRLRVPTTFVQKYTLRSWLETSGGLGDAQLERVARAQAPTCRTPRPGPRGAGCGPDLTIAERHEPGLSFRGAKGRPDPDPTPRRWGNRTATPGRRTGWTYSGSKEATHLDGVVAVLDVVRRVAAVVASNKGNSGVTWFLWGYCWGRSG